MDEIDKIIAGLSLSERRAVFQFRPNSTGKLLHFPALRDGGAMRRRLEALGLCSPKGIATKTCLQVRARLNEGQG